MAEGLVCRPCLRFYRAARNGVAIEEGMPNGDRWASYKLWRADLYECPGCGHQLVTGFGLRPLAEHYQPDYASRCQREPHLLGRVDDCGGAQP